MVDGPGGLDELLGPANRLVLAAQIAQGRRVNRDGGGFGEMIVVRGPPERGAQVRELGGEPGAALPLARAVPERQ